MIVKSSSEEMIFIAKQCLKMTPDNFTDAEKKAYQIAVQNIIKFLEIYVYGDFFEHKELENIFSIKFYGD